MPSYLRPTQSSAHRISSKSGEPPLRRSALELHQQSNHFDPSRDMRDDDEWSIASSNTPSAASGATPSPRRVLRTTHERLVRELPRDEVRERGRLEALEDYTFIMLQEDFHEEAHVIVEAARRKQQHQQQRQQELQKPAVHAQVAASNGSDVSSLSDDEDRDDSDFDIRAEPERPVQPPPAIAAPSALLIAMEDAERDAIEREKRAAVAAAVQVAHLEIVRFAHLEVSQRLRVANDEQNERELISAISRQQAAILQAKLLQREIDAKSAARDAAPASPRVSAGAAAPSLPLNQAGAAPPSRTSSILLEEQMRELVEDNKRLLLSLASAQRDIARLSSSAAQPVAAPPVHPALQRVHQEVRETAQVREELQVGGGGTGTVMIKSLLNVVMFPFQCCRRHDEPPSRRITATVSPPAAVAAAPAPPSASLMHSPTPSGPSLPEAPPL